MDNHTVETPLKRCSKCKNEHSATPEYFNRCKRNKDGLATQCKECTRASRRHFFETHPEKRNEYLIRDRAKHWDERKAHAIQYRQDNRDRISKREREYRAKNADRIRKRERHYKRTYGQIRRSQQHNVPDAFGAEQIACMMDYWNNCCAYCGAQQDFWNIIQKDHWIPITDNRLDNPGTIATNMLPACKTCNTSKGNRDPLEWLTWKFGKRKAKEIAALIQSYFDSLRE